jgi:beta-galactosidase
MRTLTLLFFPLLLSAAPPPLDTVLYGASYYHEYMPYERLEKDVELMQKAGLTVIRLGESTWSSWEPRDGQFEYAWMDRILDRLHKAGIRVILGTPTYSIPPWLYKKHPDIVVTRFGAAPPLSDPYSPSYPSSVTPGAYGPRQNMDLTHPAYRKYAERVIRAVVSHCRNHPAIIGYQVDNETGPNGLPLPNVQRAFADYLKEKYGKVDVLNKAWGFAYWGQLVNDWDELPARDGILNPGYKLEWERYQRRIVTEFLAWQAKIVREYARPEQFVTHNFVGGIRTNLDQWEIARHLDVAAVNPYHSMQDRMDLQSISLSGDLCRSLRQQSYLVTETNAQTIGWDSRAQYPPYDGQLRLAAYAHIASGANMVAYWHWHSLHYGQETYWKGLLSHDLEPNRVYREASRVGAELKSIGPRLANLKKTARAAVLLSLDSYHGIQFMPFSDRVNYMTVLNQMYGALYRLNVEPDFITPETADWSQYRVLLVPPLYTADDATLGRVAKFVENGGHAVVAFKSGFTNEHSTVRWEIAPGPLRKAAGVSYQEFSSLAAPVRLKPDPYALGERNTSSVWAEFLVPEGAATIVSYDHPFFGRYPAVTRNRHGKGTLTYEGTYPSQELQQAIIREVLTMAGLTGPDQDLPAAVKVRHGAAAGGALHYYLNVSAQNQSFTYPYGSGEDLLARKTVRKGDKMQLSPWDVAIIAESAREP